MMTIQANLLDTQFQFVAHQVNCRGVMGAGVAKALNEATGGKLLKEYRDFIEEMNEYEEDLLGKCYWYYAKNNRVILNLFAQRDYGTGKCQTNYDALRKSITEGINMIWSDYYKEDGCQMCIAIPYKMGCGLAGGDWNKVTEILEEIEREYNVLFIAHKI